MIRKWLQLLAAMILMGGFRPSLAQEYNPAAANRQKQMTSALHGRVMEAGGHLTEVRTPNPANLYVDLKSLAKDSDEIVLVHIIGNWVSELSQSGEELVTRFDADVIRRWKGEANRKSVTFYVPLGNKTFPDSTSAEVINSGFQRPLDGERYVVFLRREKEDERQPATTNRLTGDGIQGAFHVTEETILPAYSNDELSKRFVKMRAQQFLKEVSDVAQTGTISERFESHKVEQLSEPGMPITEQSLQKLGLSFPPYMPRLSDLLEYQKQFPVQQKLKVEWSAFAGPKNTVRRVNPAQQELAPDFRLLNKQRNTRGNGMSFPFAANRNDIVIVGITTGGEIRGIAVKPVTFLATSSPAEFKNDEQNSSKQDRSAEIFDFAFPDDSQLQTILFLRPRLQADTSVFEQAGTVEMQLGARDDVGATSMYQGSSKPGDYSYVIREDMLRDLGFWMPVSAPTLGELRRYQSICRTHQEIEISWDALPGHSDPVPLKDFEKTGFVPNFAPNFTLLQRQQHLRGAAGGPDLIPYGATFIVVASTQNGEIRGLQTGGPQLIMRPDLPLPPGARPDSPNAGTVFPRATFKLRFPDEPQIRMLTIFRPSLVNNQLHLEKFATIELNDGK